MTKISKYIRGKFVLEDGTEVTCPVTMNPKKYIGKEIEDVEKLFNPSTLIDGLKKMEE
jgi:hypothetical protein